MLASPDFNVPFTIIFGDVDWVRRVDNDSSLELVQEKCRQGYYGTGYTVVPGSDHNLHMDNPVAFANAIINFLLDLDLPVEADMDERPTGHEFTEERKIEEPSEGRTMVYSQSVPQVKMTLDEIDPKALPDEDCIKMSARSNMSD